ncbi:MAG TPA: hypothetical protein VFR58_08020 [Flavisolibacter sp.]|nr:hypothetical protein [Flavisolibacter sp.]
MKNICAALLVLALAACNNSPDVKTPHDLDNTDNDDTVRVIRPDTLNMIMNPADSLNGNR